MLNSHFRGFYSIWASQTTYRILMVRRPSVVRRLRSQWSKIFFSKTAWPIKAKFYVEPPMVGGGGSLLAASGSRDQNGRHAHIW